MGRLFGAHFAAMKQARDASDVLSNTHLASASAELAVYTHLAVGAVGAASTEQKAVASRLGELREAAAREKARNARVQQEYAKLEGVKLQLEKMLG